VADGAVDAIVDLSHHNGAVNLAAAKAAGILGVINKATQGTGFVDPSYAENRTKARGAGLLWGAYHFGIGGDGVAQAEHFLNVVSPGPDELLVLDFEANRAGPSMVLEECRAFVSHVSAATGRPVVLYSGHYVKDLLGSTPDPLLAACPLWLAQYGPTPVVPRNWASWALWQYTDGAAGVRPQPVPGIGRCDRDRFNGDANALVSFWRPATTPARIGHPAAAETSPMLGAISISTGGRMMNDQEFLAALALFQTPPGGGAGGLRMSGEDVCTR